MTSSLTSASIRSSIFKASSPLRARSRVCQCGICMLVHAGFSACACGKNVTTIPQSVTLVHITATICRRRQYKALVVKTKSRRARGARSGAAPSLCAGGHQRPVCITLSSTACSIVSGPIAIASMHKKCAAPLSLHSAAASVRTKTMRKPTR